MEKNKTEQRKWYSPQQRNIANCYSCIGQIGLMHMATEIKLTNDVIDFAEKARGAKRSGSHALPWGKTIERELPAVHFIMLYCAVL